MGSEMCIRDRGTVLPAYLQSETELLHSRAGTLFWEAINEVPDTPGDAAGVGHVLTVTGENDQDFAFRSLDAIDLFSRLDEVVNANRLGLATAETDIGHVADLQSVTVSTATSYENTLTSQLGSPRPLILVIDTAISGTRSGTAYTWPAGQVLYFEPASASAEALFVLSQTGGSATDATARASAATNAAAIAENDTEIANLQGGFSTNHGLIVNVGAEVDAVETDVAANRETIDRDATRLAVLHPDGTETELIWLSSETATSLFRVPDVITTANRDTPTASRLVVEGYIPGVSRVSDINRVVFSGQIIRTVSSLGEGEYIDAGLFKIIVGFTNIQAKNLVNSTSNPLRLQIFYGSGGLYNVDIPRRASGTALVPYIDPALIIGGVSSGGGTTDSTARDSAATCLLYTSPSPRDS